MQVFAQEGDHASEYVLPSEFQNPVTAWQPHNPIVSPFPSYFMEEANPIDDLGQIGCMSPYPKPMNYNGVFSNEDTEIQSLQWVESPGDLRPMTDGMTLEYLSQVI